ncbi:MAG: thioredoxin domain-containing protein [Bacteroidaceae bacterium]|jgi:thioredoxin
MRQTFFLVSLCLALTVAAGCSNKSSNGQPAAAADSAQAQAPAQQKSIQSTYITQEELRTKLFDYTAKEFSFLGERPCVLDIYATWCGPCKQLAPVLDELATELAGQVDFYKLDGEKEADAASAIGVRAYPTLLLMAPGKKPILQVGSLPKDVLRQLIQKELLQ